MVAVGEEEREGTGLQAPGWQEHGGPGTHPRHPGTCSPSLPRHPRQWPLSPGTCCGSGVDPKQSQPGSRGTSCSTRGAAMEGLARWAWGQCRAMVPVHPSLTSSELALRGPKIQRDGPGIPAQGESVNGGFQDTGSSGPRKGGPWRGEDTERALPGGPWRRACLTWAPLGEGGGRAWVGGARAERCPCPCRPVPVLRDDAPLTDRS